MADRSSGLFDYKKSLSFLYDYLFCYVLLITNLIPVQILGSFKRSYFSAHDSAYPTSPLDLHPHHKGATPLLITAPMNDTGSLARCKSYNTRE